MNCKQIFLLACSLGLIIFSTTGFSRPQRIVSLNLCADQLLMELLPPQQLVGITQMATNPDISYSYEKAKKYHTHSGRTEEIIALQPDLIVAGQFTSSTTNQLLEQLGYSVIKIGLPRTILDVFQQIKKLAQQVNAKHQAEALITNMQGAQKNLLQAQSSHPLPRAAVYYANGYSAGKNTITHEILNLAGYSNIAAEYGLTTVAPFSLEKLLASRPEILIFGHFQDNQASLAHQLLQHTAIQTLITSHHVKTITMPDRYWNCAGPSSIAAAQYLAGLHSL